MKVSFTSSIPGLTIEPLNIWLERDFMAFGIGLTPNPGTLWEEVLEEPSTLVSLKGFNLFLCIYLKGLMSTSAIIYWTLHKLSIPVDIRNVCVFLAPVFASLTSIAGFLITKVGTLN